MSEPLVEAEKQDMRAILERFYGPQATNWRVSLKTFDTLGKMIEKTKACDSLMALVPRPYRGGAVVKWAKKEVRQFVLRKLHSKEGKHYIVCMKAVAGAMKTEFYLSGAR